MFMQYACSEHDDTQSQPMLFPVINFTFQSTTEPCSNKIDTKHPRRKEKLNNQRKTHALWEKCIIIQMSLCIYTRTF